MTGEQFAALVALARVRSPAAVEGARMVLVEGLQASAAAKVLGISRQQVGNALAALRTALALAQVASSKS